MAYVSFAIFFAMIIADAGYGVVLALMTGISLEEDGQHAKWPPRTKRVGHGGWSNPLSTVLCVAAILVFRHLPTRRWED